MKKIFIEQHQSPGDILMLTCAIRDLYKAHNDKFAMNVLTTAMPIWDNNPYLDRSITAENADLVIQAQLPSIHRSNFDPYHFIHAFRRFFQDQLKIQIPQGQFKIDLHLSPQQMGEKSLVQKLTGKDQRFWIINAGHKMDFTNKMWNYAKFQQVVDILKDQVLFVQCGQQNPTHKHRPLQGVINAVGLTNHPRDFIKLMYHASGVLGGVSFAHHLATMQGRSDRIMKTRGNVCIAGGRQPTVWQMYCNQAYIHRCGQYPCCDNGGCWQARIQPQNDENQLDKRLCALPCVTTEGQKIPFCMQSITVQQVVDAIRRYENCFFMYRELMSNPKQKNRQIIQQYLEKQKRQHIETIKKVYHLTECK